MASVRHLLPTERRYRLLAGAALLLLALSLILLTTFTNSVAARLFSSYYYPSPTADLRRSLPTPDASPARDPPPITPPPSPEATWQGGEEAAEGDGPQRLDGKDGGGGGGDQLQDWQGEEVAGVGEQEEQVWELCRGPGAIGTGDYIPCLDNMKAIKALPSRRHMEHRERHCPKPSPRCLVRLPGGYKVPVTWPSSRDMIWFDNVPHPKLVEYKKDQNWVQRSGDFLVFPGGGTQFKEGVTSYIQFIEEVEIPEADARWRSHTRAVPPMRRLRERLRTSSHHSCSCSCPALSPSPALGENPGEFLERFQNSDTQRRTGGSEGQAPDSDGAVEGFPKRSSSSKQTMHTIEWGTRIRVILDVGCGVASFGGSLLDKGVITMSVAPKDEHEAQIQFALERGIPAMLSVIGTQRLTYPDNSYDLIHCARCRVHWDADGGKPLMELNRILRPGGFFVWSATPVYRDNARDTGIWEGQYPIFHFLDALIFNRGIGEWFDAMVALIESICWKTVVKSTDAAGIGLVIYQKPISNDCYIGRKGNNPPLCDQKNKQKISWYVPLDGCIPVLQASREGKEDNWPKPWPERLNSEPFISSVDTNFVYTEKNFYEDMKHWSNLVTNIYLHDLAINWSSIRNVLDMNAGFGGFAAALIDLPLWVMNTVPVNGPDTLSIVFDRGLIGTYHDWCESFNTYPRTYDLLHGSYLFGNLTQRCPNVEVVAEMDRILRPGGWVLIQDTIEIIKNMHSLFRSLRWDTTIHDQQFLVVHFSFHLLVSVVNNVSNDFTWTKRWRWKTVVTLPADHLDLELVLPQANVPLLGKLDLVEVACMEKAMASRGRHGVPAREGEQRREERVEPRREDQDEQQAPVPQGPVLPPPPPVDYGVFMQGLVQAMQTQAHTQAALQAQLEAQQAQAQVPVPQAQDHGGPSIMERFKRMLPPSFKGESDALFAESWLREIEKIFRAIRPSLRTRLVAFDHCTLDEALSVACRQEREMEQYLEEKKASQKRHAAPFQRQEKKKAAH
ncbi:hypothetical protein Taro_007284 [Colocasia esculenta]|uniref:Methyltransferase n=1 Tax=Colocasia esculenta TaxID=4460 RepID=A0A843TYH5_COLES|nr:hypothetical protein [Colocasia esculenta]